MRVTYPSILDEFSCPEQECLCRRVRQAELPAETHVGRAAVQAALNPQQKHPQQKQGKIQTNDFPLLAVRTADGANLSFDTLCPRVRQVLVHAQEPTTPAHSQGGWRQPLHVWQPAGKPVVRLLPDVNVPWLAYTTLQQALLDVAAEPALAFLARLTRVAMTADEAQYLRALPSPIPTLTPRGFLAFRAFLESRTAAADPEALTEFLTTARAMLPELHLHDSDLPRFLDALSGEWREPLRTWLVPVERDLSPTLEAWLGVRLLALPFDRDVSLARAWTELLESVAVALRYLAALGEMRQSPLTPELALVALTLGEHFVALQDTALPPFEQSREVHDRGPRMADLDMSLESIC